MVSDNAAARQFSSMAAGNGKIWRRQVEYDDGIYIQSDHTSPKAKKLLGVSKNSGGS